MRPALILLGAVLILMGLTTLGAVNGAVVFGDGDDLHVALVPLDLAGLGLVALGACCFPPRWKGEPQREEIEGGGAATVLFPYMRRPVIAVTAALTLLSLAAMYALVLAFTVGGPSQVAGSAMFVALLTWGAVASVRQLRSPRHVALTPDLLGFRTPGGRLDVPWSDIQSIGLATRGFRFFCVIRLFDGAPEPFRDRATRRAYRRAGEDVIEVTWLTCHPELLFAETERFPPPDESSR